MYVQFEGLLQTEGFCLKMTGYYNILILKSQAVKSDTFPVIAPTRLPKVLAQVPDVELVVVDPTKSAIRFVLFPCQVQNPILIHI